jgi:hypothetical protein
MYRDDLDLSTAKANTEATDRSSFTKQQRIKDAQIEILSVCLT